MKYLHAFGALTTDNVGGVQEWPIWAKAMKHFSNPEDKGIGDTVARMIGDEKSEAFKAWHHATFGKPCNCNGRQSRWNRLYPLP